MPQSEIKIWFFAKMRTWLFQQIDYKHYKYGSKNRFEMIFFCNCEMRITHNTQGFPRLFPISQF